MRLHNGRRLALLVTAAVALAWVVWPAWGGEKGPSDDKVALVNGSVITRADFDREMGRAKQVYAMGRPVKGSQLKEIKERALENLIERELLYQESQSKGIKVSEDDVKKQVEALKKRFPNEDQFKKMLDQMNMSEDLLRAEFKRGMAAQKFIEGEIARKVKVSGKEVSDFYDKNQSLFKQPEQIKASHILIKTDPLDDEAKKGAARKKLEDIEKRVKKGADFEALAKEFSQCPSSSKGGDLGYFGSGQMVKPFEDAALALKPGEVSDIVETKFGYHLIKLTERKPEMTMALKDVEARLQEHLGQQKVQEEVGKYVAKLKEKAKVERFFPKEE